MITTTTTKPPPHITQPQTLNPSHTNLSWPPSIRSSIFRFPPTRINITGGGGGRMRMRMRVRGAGGYTKRKLETAGAYEVVDEVTGERVIVWGGKDDELDDDKLMASKEVLFWKPAKGLVGSGGGGKESAMGKGDGMSLSVQGLRGGAGRLKAQKVRNLVRKVSREKLKSNKSKSGDDNGIAMTSDSDDMVKEKKRISSKSGSGPSPQSQTRPKTPLRSSEKPSEVLSTFDRALSSNSDDSFKGKKRIASKNGSRPSSESPMMSNEIQSSSDSAMSSASVDSFMEKKRLTSKKGIAPSAKSQMKPKNTLRSSEKLNEVPSSLDRALSSSSDDFLKETNHITSSNGSPASPESKRGPKSHLRSSEMLEEVPSSSGGAPPSRGWGGAQGRRSMRDDIENLKRRSEQSADGGFFSKKSFKEMGCSDEMIQSLRGQLFTRPSHIQAMAFAPALQGKSCIIADQSGSGKTLAYLLPVVQRLRQEEVKEISNSFPRSPRAIVLVPTAELASQVLRNCRSLSKFGIPFRSMVATGGFRQKTQLESLDQDIDVLIITPGRFLYLVNEGFLELTNLRCVVLDEVDILYSDEDFELALQSLITSALVSTQYLFVTATLPLDVYNKLVEVFPDAEVIMGPGVHRTSSALEEVLVDCSGDEGAEKSPETAFTNKKSALYKLAEESPVPKTIVFCNKIETCRKVENALSRFDRRGNQIRVLPFHAALAQETRLANMKEFLAPQSGDESLFLICTDRASRGIDFEKVDHVILFDFPRDPSEYVRRVGRTARGAGGRGKAFVFVVGKQVSLARRIMERNLKGHPLHEVPASFELMLR